MNRSISTFASVLASAAFVFANVSSLQNASAETAEKPSARSLAPTTPPSAKANTAANKFAVKLFQGLQAAAPQENIVLSPTSLSTVFSLITAGAGTEDQKTILQALGYESASMRDVLKDAEVFEKSLANNKDYAVTSKNALFTNTTLDGTYRNTIETSLKASNAIVDFKKPETATTVNAWADKETNGLIKEIVKTDEIDTLAFLGLNATFLDAKWGVSFDSPRRNGMDFTGDDGKPMFDASGKPVKVPLMTSNPQLQVVEVEYPTFTVYDIPYKAGADGQPQGSFQVLLPKIVNEEEVRKALWTNAPPVDAKMATVGEIVGSLTEAAIDQINADIELKRAQRSRSFMIHIPKFKAEYTSEHSTLKTLVSAWGAGSIFSQIDLAGMVSETAKTSWGRSRIALIKQKATIEVSETGTKAAAVSAIGGFPESCPPPQVYVNRPFAYLVRDAATGRIVFAGTYMNPMTATQP